MHVADAHDDTIGMRLYLVPGAVLLSKISDGEDGPQEKFNLTFRLHQESVRPDILKRELIIRVWDDFGGLWIIGTKDYPCSLSISQGNTVDCSCEWVKAL